MTVRRLLDYSAVAEVMEGAEAARIAANAATAKANDFTVRLDTQLKQSADVLQKASAERQHLADLAGNLGTSGLFVIGTQGNTAYLRTATTSTVTSRPVTFDNLGITMDVAEIPVPQNVMVGLQGPAGTLGSQVPSAPNASGTAGTTAWDANYLYVCVAPNQWKRVALAAW